MHDSAHQPLDPPDSLFQIGNAELDVPARQLRFDGDSVDVQPKVFDLLAYLVQHRDRVVSKDELFDEVWPSVVVSDASLSQTIKRARDLFRSRGFDNDIIRTVARRGYQFDHEVQVQPGGSTVSGHKGGPAVEHGRTQRRGWLIGAALAVVTALLLWPGGLDDTAPPAPTAPLSPAAAANSVAVMPFENLTPDEDFVYFTDGLTETLINRLATVGGLRVIARSSAYSASRNDPDPATIGADLRVANLLLGSVQREGDSLRISVRLVRSGDNTQVWSKQYNRELDNAFDVQDAIARNVVQELSRLLQVELSEPRPTDSAESAEVARLVLRGKRERRNGSRESILRAEALFRQALAIDPDYSPALVSLAEAVRWRGVTGSLPRDESFRESLTLLERAVRLTPDYGLAYIQLAELQHRHFWDFAGAQASFDRALALIPGSGDVYSAYSRFLAKSGQPGAALASAREAAAMDPRSTRVYSNLVLRLVKAGELEEARQAIESLRALEAEHVDLPWLETNWHLRNGSYRDALQWITLEELDHLRLSLGAIALQRLERTTQAEQMLAELIEKDAEGSAFQIAEVYAQWGDAESAFDWLERALQNGDPGLIELYSSLNLENLYGDPRFLPLAERIGLPPAPAITASPETQL